MPEQTFVSCNTPEPFIRLGQAVKVPKLRYSLPQSSCFESKGYIPLNIPGTYFKVAPGITTAPPGNFWEVVEQPAVDVNVITGALSNFLVSTSSASPVASASVSVSPGFTLSGSINSVITAIGTGETVIPVNPAVAGTVVGGQGIEIVAQQAANGVQPVLVQDMYGAQRLRYQPKPKTVSPTISIVEHYRTCHYLGDYGAGRTIKTFSLLPGEKTTISIRSFKQLVKETRVVENVLDSFSEESADELESLVEKESNFSEATNKTEINSSEISGGLQIKIPLPKVSIGLGVGGGISKNTTTNSVRSANMRVLNSSLSKQVSRSSAARNIEVNTEENVKSTTEEENTIIREIENINYSRTLNFVFRQLLQEYISVTYLDDISIVFSNGYPESKRIIKLHQMEEFLDELIQPANKNAVRDAILAELSSIYDYQGNRQCFIEKKTEDIFDWQMPPVLIRTYEYFRKRANLLMTYDSDPADPDSFEVTVPGVILDVTSRILRTDSLIAESLLGQGEALDCYNMKLQAEATNKAMLENEETQLKIDIIDLQATPADKADKYKKVYGNCCENPQIIP